MADCVVISSVFALPFLFFFFPLLWLTTIIPLMPRRSRLPNWKTEITHQKAKNWHRIICLMSCSWTVMYYSNTTVIMFASMDDRCRRETIMKQVAVWFKEKKSSDWNLMTWLTSIMIYIRGYNRCSCLNIKKGALTWPEEQILRERTFLGGWCEVAMRDILNASKRCYVCLLSMLYFCLFSICSVP